MGHRNTFFSTIIGTYICLTAFFVRNRAVECVNWLCTYPNLPIEDRSVTNSTISVNIGAEFISIVVQAAGTHTWQSDLAMYLSSPDGVTALLVEYVGFARNDFNISFDDNASGKPNRLDVNGARFLPNDSFSIFNESQVTGNWTFQIYDDAGGDEGVLEEWCIVELCYGETSTPTTVTSEPTTNPSSVTASPTGETQMPTIAPSQATLAPVPTPEPTSDGCFHWVCANPNLNIIDYETISSVITLEADWDYALFEDMTVRVVGTHTYHGDLVFYLEAPDGTMITLTNASTYAYGNGDFNITFDDLASERVSDLDVNGSSFRPSESFSLFNGVNVNGEWRFHIYDTFWADQGTFEQWCIVSMCYGTPAPSQATLAPVPTPEPTDDGCFHWECANPYLNITDLNTVYSSINLEADFNPAIVEEMTVRVVGNHTYHNDLILDLIAPDGTVVTLAEDIGYFGSGEFNITFDDNAAYKVYDLDVAGASFRPNQSFALFDNVNINGNWTLAVTDVFWADGGILEQWCIVLMCYDISRSPTQATISPTDEPTAVTNQPTVRPTAQPIPEPPLSGCITSICTYPDAVITSLQNASAAININVNSETELINIIVSVQGTHTWQSDLHIVLIAPNGEEVILVSHVGSDNDDFNIAFDDNAPEYPHNLNVAGYAFKPQGNLSSLEGIDVSGSWVVKIYDNWSGDEGVFEEWCIVEMCYGPTMSPTTTDVIISSGLPSNGGGGKSSSGDLSTGGVVGISIACSVLVIIIIGILCFKLGVCYNKEVEKNKDDIQMEIPTNQGHQLLEDDQMGTNITSNFSDVINPEGPSELTTGSTDTGN